LPGNESHPVAADAIGSLLARKPDAVLGLATGSSPLAIYTGSLLRFKAAYASGPIRGQALATGSGKSELLRDELTNRCADGTVTYARAKVLACRTYETSARPTAP